MTTKQLADLAGVNPQTVLYYERRNLLPEPPRTKAGYRQYDGEHLAHLNFIKRAQELGFTLEEIGELLALRASSDPDSGVLDYTAEKLSEIEAKMRDLQLLHDKLTELREACTHRGHTDSCLVLHALEAPRDQQPS